MKNILTKTLKTAALIVFTTSASIAVAQDTFKKNDVYIELLGNGVLGSINYDRQLSTQPGLGVRFGIGTVYDSPKPTVDEEFLITYTIAFN